MVGAATPRRISPAAAAVAASTTAAAAVDDEFLALLNEARERIRAQMTPAQIEDPGDEDIRLAESIIRPLVDAAASRAAREGRTFFAEPDVVVRQIMDEIFGFGPLAPYLNDPEVEEIICNGPRDIYIIHATRGKEKVGAAFRSDRELINFVNRVAATDGRRLDRANPKIDARMRDGSRLHAVMKPLTVNCPVAVTIRRHRLVARTIEDLVRVGTITPQVGEFLRLAVLGRLNIVVAGGTASGKTNFLNALCAAADDNDRFVVVEDTPELQILKPDVVQMTTRAAAEDARAFTMADLIIEALRMRPDRIITGEARGPEIVDILMAANTGHDGQMLTIHANSTRDVVQRMETMYLLRGVDVPLLAIRRQIADAFQLIVFLRRVFVGKQQRRFVTEVAEMQPSQFMEGDRVVIQNIFEDRGSGLAWTGYYPERLAKRLEERGIPLSPKFFRDGGGR
ncbi:MAG: ATPase, T2SS/T4P/T4SS family [Armatimonadota bacterium]|nr:ATPase, T2SS/T4P/T4SS family [Armatimonadota bacterium]